MNSTTPKTGKILVVGSTNTDMVVKTDHLPRPGETVLGGTFLMNPGGKGANQAVAAARLGAEVTFVCKTGNDLFGVAPPVSSSPVEGIDTSFVFTDPHEPSGVALIAVDNRAGKHDRRRIGSQRQPVAAGHQRGPCGDRRRAYLVLMQLETPMPTVRVRRIAGRRARQAGRAESGAGRHAVGTIAEKSLSDNAERNRGRADYRAFRSGTSARPSRPHGRFIGRACGT